MPSVSNRRDFMKASASVLALTSLRATAQPGSLSSPNGQITLGCIGLGTHGIGWNLEAFLKIPEARVLAVCAVF